MASPPTDDERLTTEMYERLDVAVGDEIRRWLRNYYTAREQALRGGIPRRVPAHEFFKHYNTLFDNQCYALLLRSRSALHEAVDCLVDCLGQVVTDGGAALLGEPDHAHDHDYSDEDMADNYQDGHDAHRPSDTVAVPELSASEPRPAAASSASSRGRWPYTPSGLAVRLSQLDTPSQPRAPAALMGAPDLPRNSPQTPMQRAASPAPSNDPSRSATVATEASAGWTAVNGVSGSRGWPLDRNSSTASTSRTALPSVSALKRRAGSRGHSEETPTSKRSRGTSHSQTRQPPTSPTTSAPSRKCDGVMPQRSPIRLRDVKMDECVFRYPHAPGRLFVLRCDRQNCRPNQEQLARIDGTIIFQAFPFRYMRAARHFQGDDHDIGDLVGDYHDAIFHKYAREVTDAVQEQNIDAKQRGEHRQRGKAPRTPANASDVVETGTAATSPATSPRPQPASVATAAAPATAHQGSALATPGPSNHGESSGHARRRGSSSSSSRRRLPDPSIVIDLDEDDDAEFTRVGSVVSDDEEALDVTYVPSSVETAETVDTPTSAGSASGPAPDKERAEPYSTRARTSVDLSELSGTSWW